MSYELDSFRRCKFPVQCSKCKKIIPTGSPNFTYNTRNRDMGRFHEDCNQPDGWNAKHSRVEPDEVWKTGVGTFVTKAKFNGSCFTCGKPTVQGITDISPCKDGQHWRHSYCPDTTSESADIPNAGPTTSTTSPVPSVPFVPTIKPVPPVKIESVNSSEETGKLDPITSLIWEKIRPLVGAEERRNEDVGEQVRLINDLIEQLQAAQNKLNVDIEKRPMKELVVVRLDDSKVKFDCPHPMLELLLTIASTREHVYLYGPAGSGKSTGAMQVSEALGLEFYSVSLNRQSAPSLLVGFMDAHGKYVETDFYKAYKNGGVFLIDEMDNASGNLLTTLNSALANGHMTFPCERVKRHADFICIATGNTCGRGADRMYNERQQLDAATLDRFTFIEWGYDETAEMLWALTENPDAEKWVKHVQAIRANAVRTGVRVAVTPRASLKGSKLLKTGLSFDQLDNLLIRKGVDADTWQKIKDGGRS